MKTYILVETGKSDATFISNVDGDKRYYEIYQLENFILKSKNYNTILVTAETQRAAFTQLKKLNASLNLMKRSTKKFYESILIL